MSLIKLTINMPSCGKHEQQNENNGLQAPLVTTRTILEEMVGLTHEQDKREEIWSQIVENESAGVYYYSVKTDAWEYRMRNGLYILNPIGPKR